MRQVVPERDDTPVLPDLTEYLWRFLMEPIEPLTDDLKFPLYPAPEQLIALIIFEGLSMDKSMNRPRGLTDIMQMLENPVFHRS